MATLWHIFSMWHTKYKNKFLTPGWQDNAGSFDKLIPLLSPGKVAKTLLTWYAFCIIDSQHWGLKFAWSLVLVLLNLIYN